MPSNGADADRDEAAERRKRKAERLADDPSVQKVQKKIKIKQEPPDPNTEIAESVSDDGGDGQAEQTSESESDDSDEQASDDGESDGGSASPSSSDTDAESSSESEREEEDQEPEQPATEPLQPAASPTPEETEIRPSNINSTVPSNRIHARMKTYFDVVANLKLSDPVATTAIESIASALFEQVFPAAAQELARQQASSSVQLKDRNVGGGKAARILKKIRKALSPKIAVWLKEVSEESGAFRTAIDAVSREGRQEEESTNATTEQLNQTEEQHTSSIKHPQPNANETKGAPSRARDQTVPPPNTQRPPGYLFQVDESATPSVTPSVASNSHIPPTGPSASRATPSADRPGPIIDSFQLFGRHVQQAVRRSPDIPETKIWGRARRVWERLLEAERGDWDDLYDQMAHHETPAKTIAATTEPAGFLIEKHQILEKIRRLDATSKTPTPRPKTPGPGKKGKKGKKVKTPKGPSGKNGRGSSKGRSVDSYRPAR